MRYLLPLLLLPLCAVGQPAQHWAVAQLAGQQAAAKALDPTNMVGVGWVWKASDTGTNVTVSQWIDEMKGYYATNSGASRPTNDVKGVRFDSAKFLYVTNGLRFFDPTNSWFVIFTMDNVGGQKPLMRSKANLKGINVNGVQHFISTDADFTDNPITVGSVQDFCWGGGAAGTVKSYTNGIQAKSGLTLASTAVDLDEFGSEVTESKNWMQWFIVFTNTMDSTTLSNLHYLRTNYWGGSP